MNRQEQDAEQILKTRRSYEECRIVVTESDLDFFLRYKIRFIIIYIALAILCIGGSLLLNFVIDDIRQVAIIMIPILVFGSVQSTMTIARLNAKLKAIHKMRELEKANQWLDPTVKTPVD